MRLMRLPNKKVYHFDCSFQKLEIIGKQIILKKRKQQAKQGRLLFNKIYKKKQRKLKKVSNFIVCAQRFLPPIINFPENEI